MYLVPVAVAERVLVSERVAGAEGAVAVLDGGYHLVLQQLQHEVVLLAVHAQQQPGAVAGPDLHGDGHLVTHFEVLEELQG